MVKLTAFIFGSLMHLYWGYTHTKLWKCVYNYQFKKYNHILLFFSCMHNVLWDIHTISPVLHKLCKLVPVSRPFSQWGVWVDAITWYCHILTAEPHFNSETENTHTEYLNTSSTAIYLQKMANELRSTRTCVVILLCYLKKCIGWDADSGTWSCHEKWIAEFCFLVLFRVIPLDVLFF